MVLSADIFFVVKSAVWMLLRAEQIFRDGFKIVLCQIVVLRWEQFRLPGDI